MRVTLDLQKRIVFIFFVIFLGVGLFLVKDYGTYLDEATQREVGVNTIDYVVKGDQSLLQFRDRDYGPFFEVVLVALEEGLHLSNNIRSILLMRHLTTFLLFYLGVIFFYKLCKEIFGNWETGLLGCLFLILSPRIFADAFYNSKDIPCLSLFIICAYTLINYLKHKTFLNAFINALTSSILIDIRIVGIILPFLTFLFISIDLCLMYLTGKNFKRAFLSFCVYCFFLVVFTILFWPFLWPSPLNNFIFAFSSMSHFTRWEWTNLYLGRYIKATLLPWHYIPVWIVISSPLVYVISFCFGYLRIVTLAARSFEQFYRDNRSELIILLLVSLPILAVILLKSVVYDAWRQMFFIYPFFLVISITGLRSLFTFVKVKKAYFIQKVLIFLIIFDLFGVVLFMIKNHPYQNVYFNRLAGRNMKEIKNRFDLDYWGLSFTRELEYILRSDSDPIINIYVDGHHYVDGHPAIVPTGMLENRDIERLVFVSNLKDAKYFMSNFRWHKEDYQLLHKYYSIKVNGEDIAVVYQHE